MSNTPNLEFFTENDYISENSPENLVVNVDGFEGPLDMLLTLSRTQKVDLLKISISQLASQYLDFVAKAKQLVFGDVGIEGARMGPSEVTVVADSKTDINQAITSIAAQQEHGLNSQSILFRKDKKFIKIFKERIFKEINADFIRFLRV